MARRRTILEMGAGDYCRDCGMTLPSCADAAGSARKLGPAPGVDREPGDEWCWIGGAEATLAALIGRLEGRCYWCAQATVRQTTAPAAPPAREPGKGTD